MLSARGCSRDVLPIGITAGPRWVVLGHKANGDVLLLGSLLRNCQLSLAGKKHSRFGGFSTHAHIAGHGDGHCWTHLGCPHFQCSDDCCSHLSLWTTSPRVLCYLNNLCQAMYLLLSTPHSRKDGFHRIYDYAGISFPANVLFIAVVIDSCT